VFVYLFFALLIFVGSHYTLAALVSGATGVLIGYLFSSGYIFEQKGSFLLFVAMFSLMYFTNIVIQSVILGTFATNAYVSGLIATAVTAVLSFVIQRTLIFRGNDV
jgi:putative flippase GtrA